MRPMHDGSLLIGPAITVRTRPGDNLFVHKALDMAQPGDVVVVDAGGDLTNSIIGEMMLAYAATKKLGGIVINGAVRDVGSLRNEYPALEPGPMPHPVAFQHRERGGRVRSWWRGISDFSR